MSADVAGQSRRLELGGDVGWHQISRNSAWLIVRRLTKRIAEISAMAGSGEIQWGCTDRGHGALRRIGNTSRRRRNEHRDQCRRDRRLVADVRNHESLSCCPRIKEQTRLRISWALPRFLHR